MKQNKKRVRREPIEGSPRSSCRVKPRKVLTLGTHIGTTLFN